jgi:hypothetical protein
MRRLRWPSESPATVLASPMRAALSRRVALTGPSFGTARSNSRTSAPEAGSGGSARICAISSRPSRSSSFSFALAVLI